MHKILLLVVVTGGLALVSEGCSGGASKEAEGSTSSHLDDDPNIVDGNYVETYADEATATSDG